jgi:hypothetical protein
MGGHIQCEPLHGGVVHKKAPRLKNVISATTPSGLAAIEMRGVTVEIALQWIRAQACKVGLAVSRLQALGKVILRTSAVSYSVVTSYIYAKLA